MTQEIYDQLADEEAGQRAAATGAAIRSVVGLNPDQHAKVLQLSRTTGIPAAVVGRNQDVIEAQEKAREASDLLARSPILARQIADRDFSTVAQDDVTALAGIERAIGGFASYVMGARPGGGAPGLVASGVRNFAAGVGPGLGANAYGAAAFPFEALGIDSVGGFLSNEQRAANRVADRVAGPMPADVNIFERGILSGMRSAGQSVATLPLGLAGSMNAMLGTMGGLTFGQSYGKARDKGASVGVSGLYAMEDATAEIITEKFLGAGKLIGDAKAGMGAAQLLIRDIAREIPGEMGATLWQNFNEWSNLNPEKTLAEFVSEQPAALAETIIATVVGGGAQVGAVRGIQKAMGDGDRRAALAQQADQFAAQAEALNKLGSASKLAGRDAETFRQYVAQVADEQGGAPTEFYIDGEVLANTLNQSGITREELDAIAPVVAQQIDAALTGGMVRVPVSEFMAAGEKLTAPLIDYLRADPQAMNRLEAADYLKTEGAALQASVEAELQKRDDAATYREGIASVQAQFEGELNAAKRFTAQVNKAYAGMLANFYGATAARLGVTPDELLSKYRLRVQSKMHMGAQTLNQTGFAPDDEVDGGVNPPHPVRDKEKFAKLVESMDADGWSGRPVLVFKDDSGGMYALTGSHRIAAAKKAGIDIRVIYASEDVGNYVDGNDRSIRDLYENGNDDEVRDFLRDAGDERGALLMQAEIDAERNDPSILNQGADAPRAQISLATDITASPSVISLLAGADLSSFIHESGHFFLEVQADLAQRIQAQISAGASVTDQERGIVDDMNRLLEWFGVKGDENTTPLQDWGRMTLEEKRESHEKFARGFEAFTMEGNAPSLELQSVFQQFRSWLVRVYQNLRALNVDLNDDVRAVMGRMLATDQAIEEAEAQRNMGALFRTVETSGMTLEEFNAYQDETGGAVADAQSALQTRAMKDMRWLSRARDKALKARQQEVEEQRREIRREIRSEVLREPVYRAWQFLTGKVGEADKVEAPAQPKSVPGPVDNTVDSMFVAIAKMGGLRRDAGAADLGIDPKQRSPMPMFGKPLLLREGGKSQDSIAEALGEEGYLTLDENGKVDIAEFQEKFQDELRGIKQYSYAKDYAAAQDVAAGVGLNVAAMENGKLDLGSLIDRYGPNDTTVALLKAKRMTAKAGLDADILADHFEFDSGDAMVKALAKAAPPNEEIETRTDERMVQMFGDITSPEALQRAADEAVHNELRVKVLTREWQALQAANKVREDTGKKNAKGQKRTVDVLARAAKQYATGIIGRLKVRDIRPSQYAASAARNGKMAEQAFIAGKLDEAAMNKRNQLVNVHATKAAYDAQAEVKSAQAYFRGFDKRSKAIDPGYQDQIEAMLERFDFKPVSLKAVDKRKALKVWYDEQVEAGTLPNIPDELLNEANRKSFKDMTLEELRGLRDTVEQIEHLGRLKNKLLLAKDRRDFDAVADEVAASIVENGGDARPVEIEGAKGVVPWLEGIAAMHRKLSSLFRQMDGGKDDGPLFNFIGRGMNERGTMEDVMVEKATVALNSLYAPIRAMKGGITGSRSKVFIPEIGASLTRGGRLAVALNWGNEDNRQRVMAGDKWTEGQVQAILKTLTPTELEFVNGVWEYIDSYWPEIAAKEKRLTGVEPEKVEAAPFNVTAADGTEVEMRGGYYPIKYDTDRSDRAEQQEAAQVAKEMMQGAMTRATTRRGHTKERLKEVKRAVRKDLNVITQHVTQVAHDLAWHEWLIDTNRLLADDRIVGAIRDHYGPKTLKTMRDGVMGIATADVAAGTDIDRALMVVRSNITRATMGASLTTAFLQPFGLTQSMYRIGARHVLRGASRWAGDAARLQNSMTWIHEKSDFMRLRSKTFNRELREIRGAVDGKTKAMQVVDGGLFWMMQKMQLVADVPTWIGQYEKGIAAGEDEATAIAQADRAVIEAQGNGSTKDLAEVQRKHPMLTQFYSYFSVTMNLTAEATAATDFKNPRAVAGWLGDMSLLLAIPAILPAMLMYGLKGGGGDDEPEDWAKRVAKWQLGYLMGMVVGVREGSGMLEGFDYAGPPVARLLVDAGKAVKQTAQGEIDDPLVLAYVNLLGSAFGIPVVQAIRSYKGWKAWDEGEDGAGPQSVLLGPPPK